MHHFVPFALHCFINALPLVRILLSSGISVKVYFHMSQTLLCWLLAQFQLLHCIALVQPQEIYYFTTHSFSSNCEWIVLTTCMLSSNQALLMTYCRSCEAHRLARLVALTETEKSFWWTYKNWTTNTMVAKLWTAFLTVIPVEASIVEYSLQWRGQRSNIFHLPVY